MKQTKRKPKLKRRKKKTNNTAVIFGLTVIAAFLFSLAVAYYERI